MSAEPPPLALVCRTPGGLCALPLPHVVETMRALPITPVAGAPPFLLGLAIVRGEPVPVVDATRLLGAEPSSPARFVVVKTRKGRVILAVSDVLGVRAISGDALHELPPLLRDAPADVVAAIGALDAELLFLLSSEGLVPPPLWAALEPRGERP